jgi:beta-carotene hydroxylase
MRAADQSPSAIEQEMPSLAELGSDLLTISSGRRAFTLAIPFLCTAGFFAFACLQCWIPALLLAMYLSFVTYGSVSHDLVHRTLGLPRPVNEAFLSLIELLVFRSGHAYRLAHLQHHARFPHDDDVEGAAARMSLLRTIVEGLIYVPHLTLWALRRGHSRRSLVVVEVIVAAILFIACFATLPITPAPAVYATLMLMGTWVYPLVTSYIPHNPAGRSPLTQTRLFRGKVLGMLALQHLYHLEHHLYPQVPHHHWPKLARRLDAYFAAARIRPFILGF